MMEPNGFNTIANLIDFDPIYIVAQCDGGVGPIHVFITMVDLKEFLDDVDFYTEDVQVYYGSCVPASAIPKNPDGMEMFLIVENEILDGYVLGLEYDCEDEEQITDTITSLIGTTLEQDDNEVLTMDNMFILYGAELPIHITVSEDEVDEDLLCRSGAIKSRAEELGMCVC